jgi:AcrR family transcriptional regulator
MSSPKRANPSTFTWARIGAAPPSARTPLTRDEIVAAGIRLLDAGGPEALSMRRLGQELDAGATSLYWHVRNKDELIDLIVDVVIGEVLDDYLDHEVDGASWREQLSEVARSLRRVLLRHRHVAPFLGERPTLGPRALDAAERVMGILFGAGFDARSTSMASGALINYASGFAMFESRAPGGSGDSEQARELMRSVVEYFATLPAARYPNMLRVAKVGVTDDQQFEYGLQRLLDGFAADLARPRAVTDGEAVAAVSGDDGDAADNALLRR